jgi:hypothetical protein
MRAYKFLARGAVEPFSGVAWPRASVRAPNPWLEVEGPLAARVRGLHACRTSDLAFWLHDELWEIELDGETVEGLDCVVARRARLVHRLDAWSEGGAARFAEACVERAAARAGESAEVGVSELLAEARRTARAGLFATSAFCSALAVARYGKLPEPERDYRDERAWQSAWIARELSL